ncbi:MAG: transposase [Planctomycetota bacterium]
MGSTYTSIHLHIVFSVKDRAPLLTTGIREKVHRYVGGIIKEHKCVPITIGGTADHIHILVRIATDISTADLLRHIKSSSSRWINLESKPLVKFAW